MFCAFTLTAQEQQGIVKTIGRPGHVGEPLEQVVIRVQGDYNPVLSDSTGNFSLLLDNHKIGQAYSLKQVFRMGYQLVDEGVVGRQYPYSDEVPLEIAMVSRDVYNRTKSEIENEVRARIEREYQAQVEILSKQLEDKIISEEKHIQQLFELNEYYDKTENLINKLADRYAKIDYDRLDSLDVLICSCIEQGRLEEAETLIESKGTKQALEQLKAGNLLLEKSLEEGRRAEAKMREDYAAELMTRFDIASIKFDNVMAASLLKERMELDTARLEWSIGYALFIEEYLGRYNEAMDIYHEVLQKVDDPSLKDDIYGCIGHLYHRIGNSTKALEAYKASAEIRETHNLPVRELAKSYYNIANVHLMRNEYSHALAYLEKSSVIYSEIADSSGLASVYVTMADNISDQGDFNAAMDYLKDALRIRKNEYGENHQRVASVYVSMSGILRRLGKYDESAVCIEKAYDIFVRIFGEKHPNVASTYLSMGQLAMDTEEYGAVQDYYEKAIGIYESFYNGLHPDIAHSYNELGRYYGTVRSDYSSAIRYFIKSKEQTEKLYGRKHFTLSVTLNNLGVYYGRLEQYGKAAECYQEALDIRMELSGKEHYSLAEIYLNMSTLAYKLEKYDEAIELLEKVLQIFISYFGKDHKNVATVYNNLAQTHVRQKNYSKGLEYFDQAKSILVQNYGVDNATVATILHNMSDLYEKLKQYDQAEELELEALRISILKLGEYHYDTASSYEALAGICQSTDRWDEAEEYLMKSLDIKIKVGGENSLETARTYSELSVLYDRCQRYDRSLEYAHKALNIAADLLGWEHTRTIVYRYGVADCYLKLEQYDDAIHYFASLYDDSLKTEGPNHDYTKLFLRKLYSTYAKVMAQQEYDGRYDADIQTLNMNSIVSVKVDANSPASKMGLTGVYYVMSYEEWNLSQNTVNFFAFMPTVASRPEKTCVFYRDNEFITVPVEGYMGIWFNPEWISSEDKQNLIKKYKKWVKKSR